MSFDSPDSVDPSYSCNGFDCLDSSSGLNQTYCCAFGEYIAHFSQVLQKSLTVLLGQSHRGTLDAFYLVLRCRYFHDMP